MTHHNLFYLSKGNNHEREFAIFRDRQADPARWLPLQALSEQPTVTWTVEGAYHLEFWKSRSNLRLLAYLMTHTAPIHLEPVYKMIVYGVEQRVIHIGDLKPQGYLTPLEALNTIRDMG